MALGEIAQKDYGITSLKKYADPVYGKARWEYMTRNYLIMRERMKGVALSYGLEPENSTFDTTVLPYDTGSLASSQIYFTPDATENALALSLRAKTSSGCPSQST
jgi:hypothetical protein